MTTTYHTAITTGAAANATTLNAPLAQLDAALVALDAALDALDAGLSADATFTGTVTAAHFVGDGSGLTGIASGTGGVTNTGSTTIGADTDANGVGVIALQTGGETRLTITAAGEIQLGTLVPTRLHSVYTFGDSLTEATDYSGKLATLLGAGWAVRNQGLGGNTTTQMAARLQSNVLNAGDGECIVVLGGINDIVNDVAAATIESNLQAIYSAAAAAGLTVIACTITPFKTHASWTSGRQTVLDAVNAWIAGTATDVDYVVDSYDALEDGTSDTLAAAYDSGDHLHLSTAGYELLAQTVYDALTWTAAAGNATLAVSGGTVALNQPLRNTDSPTFHDLFLTGHLDLPVWYPTTDGTTALKITDASGTALATFDTTNRAIGFGAAPETDTELTVSRGSTGAGMCYGAQVRGIKIDASGTVACYGALVDAYHYALAGDAAVSSVIGLIAKAHLITGTGLTNTAGNLTALVASAPQLAGGTNVVTTTKGLYVDNQGAAGVTISFGLHIEDQAGAGYCYAFASGSGAHRFGSSDALLTFYGGSPVAQQTLATGTGKTVDNVITVLQNLGLVKQS